MVIAGAGDIQLDVLCSKLKNKFGVEVELSPARVPYREKIRKPLKAHGRHKKQSGGHGQFGDVWIEFEPQEEQEDMIFAENVFGGSVPKNFFPAVEKGLRECCNKGVLAATRWSTSRPPSTTAATTPSTAPKWPSRPRRPRL